MLISNPLKKLQSSCKKSKSLYPILFNDIIENLYLWGIILAVQSVALTI
jgi:hypothetical protein